MAVLTFLIGWTGDEALSSLKRRFFPDPELERARIVQEQIAKRTSTIQTLIADMSSDVRQLQDGAPDEDAIRALIEKAESLIAQSSALTPAVGEAADFADRLAEVAARNKEQLLSNVGHSLAADFHLAPGGGASVCRKGFSFGIGSVSNERAYASLSYDQDNAGSVWLNPGEAITIAAPDETATVRFAGYEGESDARSYGFDVTCRPGTG